MAGLRTIKLKPGVDTQESGFLDPPQLTESNLVRFYSGLVQKLGGWLRLTSDLFVGFCRGLHGWSDLTGNPYLALGTDQRLEVLISGSLFDITPIAQTSNIAVAFTTVIGTTSVTILDATISPSVGDWINLQTQVSVGGIVLFGFYKVATIVDPTHYTITSATAATASVAAGGAVPSYTTVNLSPIITVTLNDHGFAVNDIFNAAVSTTVATVVISGLYNVATVPTANTFTIVAASAANAGVTASENGGNARIQYLLASGVAVNTPLTGYGVGDYGAGDYGIGGAGQLILGLRQWALDNFGQDLIASPSNGKIYFWRPPTTTTPAAVVSGSAPTQSIWVFVIPQAQIVVALGAEVAGTQQPLLVRWCDAGDYTTWTASATNQAGSFFISKGSALVGGLAVGLNSLIWTDLGLWSMNYIGFPLVFGFNPISTGCGLIAARARGSAGSLVMWLGLDQFFQYNIGGGVTPIECSVWDFFFYNVDKTQLAQVFCAVNTQFNEMAWHFPISTASPLYSEFLVTVSDGVTAGPMAYVKYNYVEKVWDYGISLQYQRTAWEGQSPVGSPVGADMAGLLQQHEQGFDADGVGMQWSWKTGFVSLGEGDDFSFSDLIIPDFTTNNTSPVFTPSVIMVDYPQQTEVQAVVPQILPTSNWITYSARGRFLALGMAGSDLGTFNRLGGFKVKAVPDGKN